MILTRPDERALFALARINASPDGTVLKEYLQQCLQEQDEQNRMTSGDQVYRGQGIALVLDDLLDLLAEASAASRRIQSARTRG